MGLQAVLVDKARCYRQVRRLDADGNEMRVEGRPIYDTEVSEWFKCRMEPADTTEQSDEGHTRRTARTWIVCGKRDVKHQPVAIHATDTVQVSSDDVDLGEDAFWEIDGDVIPMRRRKGVLGFEFKVTQVRETPTWVQAKL
jgi:hypothetical protein